jgi:hypothetical protein
MMMPSPNDIRAAAATLAFGKPLVQNNLRGLVAEAIDRAALSPEWTWCSADWLGWDFEHVDGSHLEVKQSAARQSWAAPAKPSPPTFDIRARTGPLRRSRMAPRGGPAQIYVFAYHPVIDDLADHRDPGQWQFHVIRAERLPPTKRIALTTIRTISSVILWPALSDAIEAARAAKVADACCLTTTPFMLP